MRILYINNILIDIDDSTAIGIDIQSYDVKEPAKRKIKISNSFSIPITNNNLNAIGWIGGVQNDEKDIYSTSTVDYYVNNTQFIKNAKLRIESISDRIQCYVFEKPDIWDELKKVTWADFIPDLFTWLVSEKGLPNSSNVYNGDWADFITPYTALDGQHGVIMPIFSANNETGNNHVTSAYYATGDYESGGTTCIRLKTIFQYIEDTYNVSFNTSTIFTGNVFDDVIGGDMMIVVKDIYPKRDVNISFSEWFWDYNDKTSPVKYIYDTELYDETNDKTLYDLALAYIQKLNIMPLKQDDDSIRMYRFDDLTQLASVVDFSGKFTGVSTFKPYITGYNQNNKIKIETVEDGLSKDTGERNITCLNDSLEINKELFKINEYLGNVEDRGVWAELVPITWSKTSYSNFKFFVTNGQDTNGCDVRYFEIGGTINTNISGMYYAAYYSLSSEYQTLDSALDYPVYFEAKKWMNSLDVLNFEFFQLYFIRELGGSFFVNKIKGFNPDKSKQAVTLELIKISDRTPDSTFVEEIAYQDGVGNLFSDGVGNLYV